MWGDIFVVLICIFLIISDDIFPDICWPSVCLLWKNMCFFKSDFSLFLMLSFLSHLRNLDVSLLSDTSFAKIYRSICDLFILLIVSSLCKILLVCICLIYFCFCFSCLRHRQKKYIAEIILPMISSRSFMVSGLHLSV